MKAADLRQLAAISKLAYCNPFSPKRFRWEQEILGDSFSPEEAVAWSRQNHNAPNDRPNVVALTRLAAELVQRTQSWLSTTPNPAQETLQHYWDAATYLLLYRHITVLNPDDLNCASRKHRNHIKGIWQRFLMDYHQLFNLPNLERVNQHSAAHLFACLCQVHRAFFAIFNHILGNSLPIARLREKVWESLFTCDLHRYYRSLYNRMGDLVSLITGPSGTGKELVARAIGLSQYIPFDAELQDFTPDGDGGFYALNLSALSPMLVESELFGHRRGSFTGAISDRVGWLDACGAQGAVFLDEIGEIELSLQVKLLRVVQQRTFSRLGESQERRFRGKLIAATNRLLLDEIACGRFRQDFYFRLCADRIETPSLREQLDDRPEDLYELVLSLSRKMAGNDALSFASEATDWIQQHLGRDYPWLGNIRELEQCLSSILIRREYIPALPAVIHSPESARLPHWIQDAWQRKLTAEEILCQYSDWVYQETGSYEQTAKRLQLDRRTIKAKVQTAQDRRQANPLSTES